MPTYEYRCPLGHDFELFYRKISDATGEVRCPECGQIAERRLSAGAGLVFKGSGFYLTDYGKNAHRGAPPAEKGAEGAGNAKGETAGAGKGGTADSGGGDSKPDAKPAGEAKRAPDQSGAATSRETPKADPGSAGAQGGSKSKGEQKSESKPGPGKADH